MSSEQSAWKTKDLVQNYLNGIRSALPLSQEQLNVMLHVVSTACPGGVHTFLDLGCGDGLLGRLLLEQSPRARGVFIDFSEPMLEQARAHLDLDRHTVIHHDLNDSGWRSALPERYPPFDAVVSGYAIHHLIHERKQELYAQIYKLLKPGGVFVNVEHVASPDTWVEDLFNQAFVDGLVKLPDNTYTREEIAAKLQDDDADDGDIPASAEEQCAWLRDIGFIHVDIYMKIYALAVFGGVKPS